MSQAADPPNPQELHIHNAQDLFDTLDGGELLQQVALLEAIAQDPEGAQSFGSVDGQDLLDVLIAKLERTPNTDMRTLVVQVLSVFPPQERILSAFNRLWDSTDQHSVLLQLLQYLQYEGWTKRFENILMQDTDLVRATMVANIFAGHPDLTPAQQVRIAAICDLEYTVALTPENLTDWLGQLSGAAAERSHNKLQAQGQAAFDLLEPHWAALPLEAKWWLAHWGYGEFANTDVLRRALHHPDLQLETLHLLAEDPNPALQAELTVLAASSQPEARLWAIQAGADLEWQEVWQSETDDNVRLAILARLPDQYTLLETFLHPDWRFRAQAANRLIALGGVPQADLEPYLQHPQEEVRAAAARVLLETGE
jgi:hypothetical protein